MVDILASRLANRGQWNSSKNLFGKCIISIDKLTNFMHFTSIGLFPNLFIHTFSVSLDCNTIITNTIDIL